MEIFAPPAGGVTLGLVGCVAIVFAFSLRGGRKGRDASTACFVTSGARYNPAPWQERSTPPRSPTAFPCRPSSRRTPAAGCSGRNAPTTGALGAQPAQRAFAEVAAAIARFEPVTVGRLAGHFEFARAQLPPHVRVVEISHDDSWMRDVGPTFVTNKKGVKRGVDWRFNAWGGLHGGLYFPWDQDDAVAHKVLEIEGCDRYRAPLINEGGAIHVDGQGTALVTEQCLLNPNRNPELSRRADRGAPQGLPRRADGHLAGRRRGRRRNRRPHRQSRLLRASPASSHCTGPTTRAIRNTRCRAMRSSG